MYENKDRLSEKSPKITTLLVSTGRKIIKNRRMLYHQLLFAIINFNCMNNVCDVISLFCQKCQNHPFLMGAIIYLCLTQERYF